jgi:excinuclease UvrABC nuclease subunit
MTNPEDYLPKTTNLECGIYMIKNLETGNFYIGESRAMKSRLKAHRAHLSAGSHSSKLMQQEYNLLSDKSKMIFSVIIYCKRGEREEIEESCIKIMNPQYNTVYLRTRSKIPTSNESTKPWELEGISRRTWYARKREAKLVEEFIKKAQP